jgi:uncharacterized protein with von Willebrand factor type A (vWA) domain
MERALQSLGDKPNAGVLFITDGESTIGDEVLQQIQRAKADMALHIDAVAIGRHADMHCLERFSDTVYHLESPDNMHIYAEILATM